MATPASGVKPTNASQAIKGSEKSSMSPEFLSGDKNSKQDARVRVVFGETAGVYVARIFAGAIIIKSTGGAFLFEVS